MFINPDFVPSYQKYDDPYKCLPDIWKANYSTVVTNQRVETEPSKPLWPLTHYSWKSNYEKVRNYKSKLYKLGQMPIENSFDSFNRSVLAK